MVQVTEEMGQWGCSNCGRWALPGHYVFVHPSLPGWFCRRCSIENQSVKNKVSNGGYFLRVVGGISLDGTNFKKFSDKWKKTHGN